jgi:proteasome accessory factor B
MSMTEQTRRATRLVHIERLLHQHPNGLTVAELARMTNYSKRTIQRDLAALESELRIPIQVIRRRYRIDPEAAPLAPVRLTLHEARSILLASRLLARHSQEADPDAVSALHKLAETLSGPVAREVASAAEALASRPIDEAQVKILRTITLCWARSSTVAIRYHSQRAGGEQVTPLDPYLLEPGPYGSSIYVIGFSHRHNQVRTFRLDRIVQAVASGESFTPTDVSGIRDKISRSWGVIYEGEEEYDITVDFTAAVASRIRETVWHASQQLEPLPEGAVRLRVRLPSLLEFVPWVRGWGAEALVIGPPALREEVACSLRAAAARYEAAEGALG